MQQRITASEYNLKDMKNIRFFEDDRGRQSYWYGFSNYSNPIWGNEFIWSKLPLSDILSEDESFCEDVANLSSKPVKETVTYESPKVEEFFDDEPPMFSPTVTACSHERPLFDLESRKEIVEYLLKHLSKYVDEFDAIAVSGYSMALIAPIIADKLNKNIVLVRKEEETDHSSYRVEGMHGQKCIIIDDLISSGNTIRRVIDKLAVIDCKAVGYILYKHCWESSWLSDLYPTLKYMGV